MDYALICISALLAIFGVLLNTHVDEKNPGLSDITSEKKKHLADFIHLNKPNGAGIVVISLMLISCIGQIHNQNEGDKNKKMGDSLAGVKDKKIDSLSIQNGLLSKQLFTIENKTDNITSTALSVKRTADSLVESAQDLTNTASNILNKTNQTSEDVKDKFSKNFETLGGMVDQLKIILDPLLPILIRVTIEIPFEDKILEKYRKRIIDKKDSLITTEAVSSMYSKYDDVLYGKFSSLHCLQKVDSIPAAIFGEGATYRVSFCENNTSSPLISLQSIRKVDNPIQNNSIYDFIVDYRNKKIIIREYFELQNVTPSSKIQGREELLDKDFKIFAQDITSKYNVSDITLYTGENKFKTTIMLNSNDRRLLEYVHKITKEDLNRREPTRGK